jgi:hypothetical protein
MEVSSMARRPVIVSGNFTFAQLERALHDLCQQIDQVAERIPDEEDRAYAGVAKKCLWKMYQCAYEHALAREVLEE